MSPSPIWPLVSDSQIEDVVIACVGIGDILKQLFQRFDEIRRSVAEQVDDGFLAGSEPVHQLFSKLQFICNVFAGFLAEAGNRAKAQGFDKSAPGEQRAGFGDGLAAFDGEALRLVGLFGLAPGVFDGGLDLGQGGILQELQLLWVLAKQRLQRRAMIAVRMVQVIIVIKRFRIRKISHPRRKTRDHGDQGRAVIGFKWLNGAVRVASRPDLQKSIARIVAALERELATLDSDIDSAVKASPVWSENEDLLASVPGVGKVIARTLIAEMPELGTMNRKQVAALAGLAPRTRTSGQWRGKSMIGGGRSVPRTVLFLAAMVAGRYNPDLKDFKLRLLNAGKAKKAVLIAIARKLLTILNAIIRDKKPWRQKTA